MKVSLYLVACLLLACLSCNKHQDNEPATAAPKFGNVVMLGNSILFTTANPTEGWPGSWGMAASAADKDFVHLLTQQFKARNSSCAVNILNISQFEHEYATYDLNANLKDLRDSKPDLLIIRIGENVASDFNAEIFDSKYQELIKYFKTGNPHLRVFAAGSFWTGKDAVDAVMKKHSDFISLSPLGLDMSNYAWGLFSNQGIAQHPNDKGMQGIASTMWDAILKIK